MEINKPFYHHPQEKSGVAILILDGEDIKIRNVIRDKEGHYIMINESVIQESIKTLNVYVPNNRVTNYMEQKVIELRGEIDESTVTVKDFHAPPSAIDPTGRKQ